jgi:hypothetical protein
MSAIAFAERGLIEHLKGLGWLGVRIQTSTANAIGCTTYLIAPDEEFTSGVCSTPFSTILEISNTASDITVDSQTEASASWRPVHQKQANITILFY